MRLKVLAEKEAAVQEVISDARMSLKDVSKDAAKYKKLLTDLLVQVTPAAAQLDCNLLQQQLFVQQNFMPAVDCLSH